VIGRWLSGCLAVGAAAAVFLDGPANTAPVFAQGTAPGVVAIRNGTIITATRGTIANGTVLIRDGKIAAVGTNVSIPSGADVYDATGKFVSRDSSDAHSHIANDAINEGSVSVSSDDRHGRSSIPRTSTSIVIWPVGRQRRTSSMAAPMRSAARPS
jgi:hypothetical protein